MSVTIANSSPPVAIMDLTSDMFPTQFGTYHELESMHGSLGPWLFPRTPLTPLEWCTACWPSWTCRGWFCYECGIQRGFFHARLPQMAPLEYKHYVVRRVFRFVQFPGCSDIHGFNSWNRRWEYLDFAGRTGVRLVTQLEQDVNARVWLTAMYTLLTEQLHPFPGGSINAPGPVASKHLLGWLLYLRPFLLVKPLMPFGAPPDFMIRFYWGDH